MSYSNISARIKPHALNASTYAQIAAVIVASAAIKTIDFSTQQIDRIPEYQIRLKLAKVRTQQRFIRIAIAAEQARLAVAPRLIAALDKAFCLS